MSVRCTPDTITPKEFAAIGQRIHEIVAGKKDLKGLTKDDKIGLTNLLTVVDKLNTIIDKPALLPEEQLYFNLAVKKLRTPEARELIAKIRQDIKQGNEPDATRLEKLAELTASMYLWRLSSVGKSLSSNLARNLIKYPERKLSAWFNKGVARRNDVSQSRFNEEAAIDFRETWMKDEFKKSWRVAIDIMKEKPEALQKAVFFKREHIKPKAISGTKGKYIRAGLNAQGAVDALFRLPAIRGELAVLAFRKAMKATGDKIQAAEIVEREYIPKFDQVEKLILENNDIPKNLEEFHGLLIQAEKNAEKLTFQEELGGIAQSISNIRQHAGARIFVPFFNTHMNILKQAIERTPFAAFSPRFIELSKKSFNRSMDEVEAGEYADKLAQITFGTAAFTAIVGTLFLMSDDDEITGDYNPETIGEKPMGWQQNSIRIGDYYISYQGIEPFGTMFRAFGNMRESKSEGVEASIEAAAKLLLVNPLTQEVFDVVDAVRRGKVDEFFVKMVAGMVLPGMAKDISKIIDPTIRQKETLVEKGIEQTGLPGYSLTLPPMVDVFGEGLRPQTRAEKGFKVVTGLGISKIKEDDARREFKRLDLKFEVKTYQHKSVKLTPEETLRLNELAGQRFKQQINAILNNPTYKNMPDSKKKKLIKSIRRKTLNHYKKAIEQTVTFRERLREEAKKE